MNFSEFNFSIVVLVLAIPMTLMASNLCGLVLAGSRVRWAPEPVLQACLIVLIVVVGCLNQWEEPVLHTLFLRRMQSLLVFLKLLVLWRSITACLPEVREAEGEVDLFVHYDENREVTFGALAAALALYGIGYWLFVPASFPLRWELLGSLAYIGPCVAMMFLRWRWLNMLLLAAGLVLFVSVIVGCAGTVSDIFSTIFHRP